MSVEPASGRGGRVLNPDLETHTQAIRPLFFMLFIEGFISYAWAGTLRDLSLVAYQATVPWPCVFSFL